MAGIDRECLLRELLVIDRRMQNLLDSLHETVILAKDTNRKLAEGRKRIEKAKQALASRGYPISGVSI